MKAKILLILVISLVSLTATAQETLLLPNGAAVDLQARCPVCGMTVGGDLRAGATYGYKASHLEGFAGVAAAVFKDGKVVAFEGARCLFIYNTIPKRFGIDVGNITHRYVTDFKSGKLVNASDAYLVMGSDLKGPMGIDLIPFLDKKEADKFSEERHGKRVVQLDTVGAKDVDRTEK
ncbi:nitrous oxide reductase accessory protein NosL [Desulfomonile tiedjei]|uniref:Putative lipoprotein involved in nitrous oxide reduction n=1 Tax=Desulfomonile tiedjei (strain ATCC 49306 / DSM 6799 / DCB-1) TaxID=706587 RepID=I4CC12_DESTA|nr:nitrous oxide reductase accessory protein NosL [Desulfomonile tiedjei]AFM27103.1 putative lipoprotein involved in nitrous oxide reduction [Desulfomonile tiedjei DSM 6799]